MKFNWFKKKQELRPELVEELKEVLLEESSEVYEFGWTEAGVSLNGLPIVVADDDFMEFLAEEGYDESIELDDLYVLYQEWEAENVA